MSRARDTIVKLLSSFFYLGYAPIASGTVGTLAGFVLVLLLKNNFLAYTIVMLSLIVLGICVSTEAEHIFKEKDSHRIVIDEVAGYLVTMYMIPNMTFGVMVIGFFLNRVFDILKPYPIRKLEALNGGFGIMLDDVLAGVYSNLVLRVIIILLTGK